MKKISLKDVKNSLKRDEMRMISGGSGTTCMIDAECIARGEYGLWTCWNGLCVHRG